MEDRERLRERLLAVHRFPDTYFFKVIGDNTQDFIARVVQAAVNGMSRSEELQDVTTRESRSGRHVSVTLKARVNGADTVLDVYEMISVVQGVRFVV